MVHEFETPLTTPKKRLQNQRDLVRFLTRLGVEGPERVGEGVLVGPVRLAGADGLGAGALLYFGKASRRVHEG